MSAEQEPERPPLRGNGRELLDEVRAALKRRGLNDAEPDGELLRLLGEAVREYSQHLPGASEATLAAVVERRYARRGRHGAGASSTRRPRAARLPIPPPPQVGQVATDRHYDDTAVPTT